MADAKKATKAASVDFRAMNETELVQKIAELKKDLVERHRDNAAGELPNPSAIRKTRRSIAQALTFLAQKRADAAKETK